MIGLRSKKHLSLGFFILFVGLSSMNVSWAVTDVQLSVNSVWLSADFYGPIVAAKPYVPVRIRKRLYVFEYRARRNETLQRVARRYAVKVSDLVIINRLTAPYRLRSGQRIKIPWYGQKIPRADRKRVSFRVIGRNKHRRNVPKSKNRTKISRDSRGHHKSPVQPNMSVAEKRAHSLEAKPKVTRKKWDLDWVWPAFGTLSKEYTKQDKAIEIKGNFGQSVYAAAAGEVVYTGSNVFTFGKLVVIRHSKGLFSTYAHNSRLFVKRGEKVRVGQKIAEMGQNNVQTSLLRFEIRLKGKAVNPMEFLPGINKNVIN